MGGEDKKLRRGGKVESLGFKHQSSVSVMRDSVRDSQMKFGRNLYNRGGSVFEDNKDENQNHKESSRVESREGKPLPLISLFGLFPGVGHRNLGVRAHPRLVAEGTIGDRRPINCVAGPRHSKLGRLQPEGELASTEESCGSLGLPRWGHP